MLRIMRKPEVGTVQHAAGHRHCYLQRHLRCLQPVSNASELCHEDVQCDNGAALQQGGLSNEACFGLPASLLHKSEILHVHWLQLALQAAKVPPSSA